MNNRVILGGNGLTVEACQPSENNYASLPVEQLDLGVLRRPVVIDEAAPLLLRTLFAIVDQFPQLVAFLQEYCCPAISEIHAAAAQESEGIASRSQLEELICARKLELSGKGICDSVEFFALGRVAEDSPDFLTEHFGLAGKLIAYSLTGCSPRELADIPVRILPTATVTLIDDADTSHKFDLPSALSLLEFLASIYSELAWGASAAKSCDTEPESIPSGQEDLPQGASVTFSVEGSAAPQLAMPVVFSPTFLAQLNDPTLSPDVREALQQFYRDITGADSTTKAN